MNMNITIKLQTEKPELEKLESALSRIGSYQIIVEKDIDGISSDYLEAELQRRNKIRKDAATCRIMNAGERLSREERKKIIRVVLGLNHLASKGDIIQEINDLFSL
jgi:hypothetical protein